MWGYRLQQARIIGLTPGQRTPIRGLAPWIAMDTREVHHEMMRLMLATTSWSFNAP